jgi:outer membrane lipoprotein-sorting protein
MFFQQPSAARKSETITGISLTRLEDHSSRTSSGLLASSPTIRGSSTRSRCSLTQNDTRGRYAAWTLVLAVGLAAGSGCAARQVTNPGPPLAPDQAIAALAERRHLLTSLQTPAIMEYSGPSGHLKAREQFTVRRPASLRVDAMSPLGVALIVATDERQISVFDPSRNTLIRGPASAATLARFTQIPLAPAQAVPLLLGLAPDDSLVTATPLSSRTEGETKVLTYAGAGAVRYDLGFSGGQLGLVRARDGSRTLYEVHYSDYRDIGAIKFPFELDAQFFASATTVKFHYLNPLIDREIADSTFVLSPGPGTRLIELGFAALPTEQASQG